MSCESTSLEIPKGGTPAREIGWALVISSVGLIGIVAVSPWDLTISSKLADPGSAIGPIVQTWGQRPGSLLIVLAAWMLASPRLRLACPLAARASAALIAQLVIHPGLITNAIKLMAGRPRPAHLRGAENEYRYFYEFAPGLGDFSFPSGHVAVAMLLAPVALLVWRHGSRLGALAIVFATCIWAGLVAWGRVVFSAHFPTDVIFSIVAGVASAPLAVWIGDRAYMQLARPIADS